MKYRFFFALPVMALLFSCGGNQKEVDKKINNPEQYSENLEGANKYYNQNEDDQIEDFILRQGWEMTKTGSGLRCMIYKNGNGIPVADKKIVRYHYKVNLLNGRLCYDTSKEGPKEIWIGHSDVVSGVEEGLMMLREGDKAKFIIPSYLAYGWIGDSKEIPTRAVLIYDVEVVQVRNYNAQ